MKKTMQSAILMLIIGVAVGLTACRSSKWIGCPVANNTPESANDCPDTQPNRTDETDVHFCAVQTYPAQ